GANTFRCGQVRSKSGLSCFSLVSSVTAHALSIQIGSKSLLDEMAFMAELTPRSSSVLAKSGCASMGIIELERTECEIIRSPFGASGSAGTLRKRSMSVCAVTPKTTYRSHWKTAVRKLGGGFCSVKAVKNK